MLTLCCKTQTQRAQFPAPLLLSLLIHQREHPKIQLPLNFSLTYELTACAMLCMRKAPQNAKNVVTQKRPLSCILYFDPAFTSAHPSHTRD